MQLLQLLWFKQGRPLRLNPELTCETLDHFESGIQSTVRRLDAAHDTFYVALLTYHYVTYKQYRL
jgi:hypothetical protein